MEQGLIIPVNLCEQKRYNRSKSYKTACFIENNTWLLQWRKNMANYYCIHCGVKFTEVRTLTSASCYKGSTKYHVPAL